MRKLLHIFGALPTLAALVLAQTSETGQTYTFPGGIAKLGWQAKAPAPHWPTSGYASMPSSFQGAR
ncbi:MAG: hypothetical protein ABSH32_15045 [Bryobacteraceae bacterium]|jgi:hypothetical protein